MKARDHRIMQFARRQAIDTERVYSAKIAACLTIKGTLISLGRNSKRTHPFAARYSKHREAIYLHAETAAISNALNHINKEDLKRATLYIHRVKQPSSKIKEWKDGLAKPCPGCMAAITAFGISRVIYSTETDGVYELLDQRSASDKAT